MPTAAHIAKYVGRKVDVLAYQTTALRGLQRATQSFISDTGESLATTGIQKLAQMVLLELLTVRGSMPYAPEQGVAILGDIQQGRIHTEVELASAFAVAATDIVLNLATTEEDDTPDDEKLESLVLISSSLQPGEARIVFRVNSLAGTSFDMIAPINITI